MRAVRALSAGASLALAPAQVVRAVLYAPRAAAAHPRSRELRRLLDDGYAVTAYRQQREPLSTHVCLERGSETREVASTDLAFAAYAAHTVPPLVARGSARPPVSGARP